MQILLAYDWPGNIRELQNVMERSMIETSTEELLIDNNLKANSSTLSQVVMIALFVFL